MNVGNQNTQQIGQNSVNQPSTTPEKQKINYLAIGGLILAGFVVIGFGGYYLGKQPSTSQENSNNIQGQANPAATPETSIPTAFPTDVQQVASLPSGWGYKDNGECGVKFAIPPKEIPYYYPVDPNRQPSVTNEQGSGRFWNFPRGGSYPNVLSKILLPNQEYKEATTMFASPEEASGYISQAVAVSCIPNNGRFANNSALTTSLAAEIDKYNKSTGEKGMQASTYTIRSNTPKTRWNRNVMDLIATEDTTDVSYTMFVTPKYIYEVKVFGATSDSFVKDTAKKIFDYLVF